MCTPASSNDADRLSEETKESIEKARHLLDEMKTVQEHENAVLEETEDPGPAIRKD
jgi:hypothetical protein